MYNLLVSFSELSENVKNFLNNSLGIWYLVILNAFGIIAIIIKSSEYQCKKRKTIFTCAICTFICWTCYFLLQGDFVGALMNLTCLIELIVFYQRGKHAWAEKGWWLYFFLTLQLTLGILTFKIWHDVFAIVGGLLTTLSYFVLNKRTYRFISFFNMSSWVCNGAFKGYVLTLINDSLAVLSVLVSIVRFYVLKKDDEKETNNSADNIPLPQNEK